MTNEKLRTMSTKKLCHVALHKSGWRIVSVAIDTLHSRAMSGDERAAKFIRRRCAYLSLEA